jgi:hypothetical protein
LQLEAEVEALRVDAGRQQEAFMKQRAQTRAAEAQVQELQQELENNAGGCSSPAGACAGWPFTVRASCLVGMQQAEARTMSWQHMALVLMWAPEPLIAQQQPVVWLSSS